MRSRLAVGCALVLAAAVPNFAEDDFEPNPSLARLSSDDAYARSSAESLEAAGIDAVADISLDAAGRVLVAGARTGTFQGPRIVRLDADGRLDPAFGNAGVVELPVRWLVFDQVPRFRLEVDAGGRIVVAGFFYEADSYEPWEPPETVYCAARLLDDGSLDPAFSGDGLLEADAAPHVRLLPWMHAAGSDGAMLVLAVEPGTNEFDSLVGLVRLAADGTIDATYGDQGFAPIPQGPWPGYVVRDVEAVSDFAVDSAGRAVVVPWDRYGYYESVRLDADGAFDLPFWDSARRSPSLHASRIALDGEERVVGLVGGAVFRRLPDGAPDPAFSGDGYAWRVEAAGFPGGVRPYHWVWSRDQVDPRFDPVEQTGLLAVATSTDRWAIATSRPYYPARGPVIGSIRVQTIDPADPGAIVWADCVSPLGDSTGLKGLVVTPDGTTAYVLGTALVFRVDLTARTPLPLPDLRARWLGVPRAVHLGGGRYRVTARVRVRNTSRRDVSGAYGFVDLVPGAHGVPLPGDIPLLRNQNEAGYSYPFHVRGRRSVVKRFTWEGGGSTTNLAGARLSLRLACELPDAAPEDNTATSLPMTPLYAPR